MSQLFPDHEPQRPHLPGADLALYVTMGLADPEGIMDQLVRETPWREEEITVFGRTHLQPRLVAWYGDADAHYTYSSIPHTPLPWTGLLLTLRRAVEDLCATRFNSVLLNYYRDGRDSMGLHADDEPELGERPVIASLSLGETRRFFFRHKHDRSQQGLALDLTHGSLLVMAGDTQSNWKHGINKVSRPCGPRVNLTFRQIIPQE